MEHFVWSISQDRMEGFELSEASTLDVRKKTGNPQSHPLRVSFLSSSQQGTARRSLIIYAFASCLLCIAHKKTISKEERLRSNERLSREEMGMPFLSVKLFV